MSELFEDIDVLANDLFTDVDKAIEKHVFFFWG